MVSSATNTGLEVARNLFPERLRVRFPADLSPVTRRFLRAVDPALVILVELEVWPNFLRLANRTGRPVVVVNGRITRESHGRYLVFRRLLPEFNRISLFCVQSDEYARRFGMLGVEERRIVVTGNVKFDGTPFNPAVDCGLYIPRTGDPNNINSWVPDYANPVYGVGILPASSLHPNVPAAHRASVSRRRRLV